MPRGNTESGIGARHQSEPSFDRIASGAADNYAGDSTAAGSVHSPREFIAHRFKAGCQGELAAR
eukprot:7919776-Pyramimonas_sp.AAC.1